MKKYETGLFWVEEEGNTATCGFTKKTVDEIGKITFLKLPEIGAILKKNDKVLMLESHKAAIDVESPFSGKVVEANHLACENPFVINRFPEKTWLFKIEKQIF